MTNDSKRICPNGPRDMHTYQFVQQSAYVPRQRVATPTPAWKQTDWAGNVLPRTSK